MNNDQSGVFHKCLFSSTHLVLLFVCVLFSSFHLPYRSCIFYSSASQVHILFSHKERGLREEERGGGVGG